MAQKIKIFLSKHFITFLAGIIGGVAGYLYYHFVGCSSGQCAITSDPVNSSIYGIILGGLIGDGIRSNKQKQISKATT